MSAETEKKQRAELDKWLAKINPDIAQGFKQSYDDLNKDESIYTDRAAADEKEKGRVIAAAKAEAQREAVAAVKAKQEEAKKAQQLADWEKQKGRSSKALEVLLNGLIQLGDPAFLKSRQAAQKIPPSSDASIDKLLAQVVQVLELWNDNDKLPQAEALWAKTKPVLAAVLAEGENQQRQKHLDAGDGFQEARKAMSNIEFYLGEREAWVKQRQLENQMDTPDVSVALDLRQLKELEPTLALWQNVNKQAGRLAEGAALKELSLALDVYFSVPDLSKKLAAFKKAGKWEKVKTVADLVAFFSDKINESAKIITEAGIKVAKRAGQEAAAKALEKRVSVMRKVAGVVALYELGKSVGELVVAIQKGDWHEIASASFGVASSGIGVAEAVGAMEGSTAAGATGAAVVVWATAEAILMAAEIAKWARELGVLETVVRLARDAKKIVPTGKKMAAAAELMMETQGSTDPKKAGEYAVHEQEALRLCPWVAKAIAALGSNYFSGGKNDLRLLLKSNHPALNAFNTVMNFPDNPWEVSDHFRIVLDGIKAVVDQGTKTYGDAGVSLAKEEVGR